MLINKEKEFTNNTTNLRQQANQQLMPLKTQIMNNQTSTKLKEVFNIFMCEAAIGKTYTIIETLKELSNKSGKPVKTLIVTKFIDEGKTIAKELNKFKPNMAKDENSDNKEKDEKNLKNYSVLIITHAMYKKLCKDIYKRRYYIEGRTNLIIDEELNMVEMDSLSDNDIDRTRKILRGLKYLEDNTYVDLEIFFNNIISKLIEKKDEYHDKTLRYFEFEDPEVNKVIDMLKSMVNESPFTENYLFHLKYTYNILTTKTQLLDKLEILKKYFNNPKVLVGNKTLYTYDDDMKYFFLENNILLDASAKFNELYRLGEQFKLIDADRIFPHNNWTIHIAKTNSTKVAKHNDDNYYKDIVNLILQECTVEDKILVLGLEEDIANINDNYKEELKDFKNLSYSNFQNMRGKNNWVDFNKCFIIHTPVMPTPYYIFVYMLYTEKIPEEYEIKFQKINKNMGFKYNETLENLRKTDIVSGIYQGIKRINRGTAHINDKADIYLINGNSEIVDMIIKQLKDINVVQFKLHKDEIKKIRKKREQKGYDTSNRKEIKGVKEFIELLKTLELNNKYLVNDLLQQINYNVTNFSKLWNNQDIKDCVNTLHITLEKINRKNYILVGN